MEEYYELTEKWYSLLDKEDLLDVSYDTFEHLQKISDLVRGYRNISWMER